MLIDYKLQRYNLTLLNFDFVLRETFKTFNTSIEQLNLSNNIECRDTQKIFLHSLIITLCERIKKSSRDGNVAIYVNNNTPLIPGVESSTFNRLIMSTLKPLPFQFILHNIPVDLFIEGIHNNEVDVKMILESQLYYSENFDTLSYSFKGLIRFLKKYDLTYLYCTYFKQITNKLLVVK